VNVPKECWKNGEYNRKRMEKYRGQNDVSSQSANTNKTLEYSRVLQSLKVLKVRSPSPKYFRVLFSLQSLIPLLKFSKVLFFFEVLLFL